MTNQKKTGLENFTDSQEVLDDFEISSGLGRIQDEYLTDLDVARTNIGKLTPEECYEKAMQLLTYSFYLQRLCNRLTSEIKWCDAAIDNAIAGSVGNQSGYSYQERKNKAVKQNDYACKINTKRVSCDLKLTRISFLTSKIDKFAEVLIEASRYKRSKKYEQST
ncbi:MAG: hypothetical protein R3213_12770 [Flavobacteriaceae bacterium]|nr:hypothetical protein [Flavobacteriaceae bacterium]